MAQDVVGHYGWLDAGAMMDGFGLAETTPGPLILVTEFVGFLARYGKGGFWHGLGGKHHPLGYLCSVFFVDYDRSLVY